MCGEGSGPLELQLISRKPYASHKPHAGSCFY